MLGNTAKPGLRSKRRRARRFYQCALAKHGKGKCSELAIADQVEAQVFGAVGAALERLNDPQVRRGLQREWARLSEPDVLESKRIAKRSRDLRAGMSENQPIISGELLGRSAQHLSELRANNVI